MRGRLTVTISGPVRMISVLVAGPVAPAFTPRRWAASFAPGVPPRPWNWRAVPPDHPGGQLPGQVLEKRQPVDDLLAGRVHKTFRVRPSRAIKGGTDGAETQGRGEPHGEVIRVDLPGQSSRQRGVGPAASECHQATTSPAASRTLASSPVNQRYSARIASILARRSSANCSVRSSGMIQPVRPPSYHFLRVRSMTGISMRAGFLTRVSRRPFS